MLESYPSVTVLAAAIAIDLDFFESPGRRRGMTFNFAPR